MEQGGPANNGINNYKGVMLCSRPNEAVSVPIQKPFCGRVVPKQQLGLVPIKQEHDIIYQIKKPHLQILDRHKKWLNHFKKDLENKNKQIEQNRKKEEQRFQKIKQQAEKDRQRSKKIKQQYNQTAMNVINILNDDSPSKNTSQILQKLNGINQISTEKPSQSRKKQIIAKPEISFKKNKKQQKPLWAQTQQEIQRNQDQQIDELLGFFQTNHVQDYAQDIQVKQILNNLKQKIHKLKQEQDWKEKEVEKINNKKEEKRRQIQNQQNNDDKYSNFSGQSESKSIASQKTQQKIQELKAKKKEQHEWDKFSTSQKSTMVGIDERIAKNIADEVLRNYPNMRGVHSNISIRKLLEAQAAKVINQPISRPVITTIIKEKAKIDANNLPYLHRNPAI